MWCTLLVVVAHKTIPLPPNCLKSAFCLFLFVYTYTLYPLISSSHFASFMGGGILPLMSSNLHHVVKQLVLHKPWGSNDNCLHHIKVEMPKDGRHYLIIELGECLKNKTGNKCLEFLIGTKQGHANSICLALPSERDPVALQ